QCQLPVVGGITHRRCHCVMESGESGKWPFGVRDFGYPWRTLENVAERADEACLVGRVELIERDLRHDCDRRCCAVYRSFAPATSHAASSLRSSSVISVALPGGMAFERTALMSISRA